MSVRKGIKGKFIFLITAVSTGKTHQYNFKDDTILNNKFFITLQVIIIYELQERQNVDSCKSLLVFHY